ncbi:MAG TPA: DUF2079 domain-containing protein [Polyangia bacterium]|jgi:uncharacterized membrane protein|nr:DUF2079 domain-containing protein [Polyangia bacterium]
MTAEAPPFEPERDHPGTRTRALLGLIVIGASVALALGQLAIPDLGSFVTQNLLPAPRRKLMLGLLAGSFLLSAAAIAWIWRRSAAGLATARLDRLARLGAPLALAAAVPGLFAMNPWSEGLTLAISLGAFALAIEPLWRLHFGAYRPGAQRADSASDSSTLAEARRRRWCAVIVGVAVAGYVAYMIFFTLRQHARFNTYNWDLGQLDNEFYNALHGHPFRCTPLFREPNNWVELRDHATFSVYALLPLYALHPAASTLLVLQCLLLGLGAIPLYRFAARRLSPPLAVLVTLSYLVYPPMHGAQFFDFHFQPVAAAFILAAIDAFDAKRMRLFWVFFVIALGCREDVSIGFAILGLFLVVAGYRTREGAVVAAVSAVYFVALRFFIMPAVGAWGFSDIYKDLIPAGESGFGPVVKTLLTNPLYTLRTLLTPEKLRYALQIVAPLAFLPVRRRWLAVWLIPGAILTLLTTGYGPTLDIGYHYGADFVPYVFPAVVLALAALGGATAAGMATDTTAAPTAGTTAGTTEGTSRRRAAAATLVLASFIATASWGAIPPRRVFHSSYGVISFAPPTAQERRRLQALDAAMRLVPKKAILAASDRELSHVSNRIECWNLAVGTQGADYALYTKIDPIPPDRAAVANAQAAGWVTVYDSPEIGLLKRPGL